MRRILIIRGDGLEVETVIVGDGSLANKLKSLIQTLGLETVVKLKRLGVEQCSYLEHWDFLILRSQSKGLRQVFVDTMSPGIPVIVPVRGNGPGMNDEGISGWHLQPIEASKIADFLGCTKLDLNSRISIKLATRKSVKNRFSPHSYFQNVQCVCAGFFHYAE